LLCFGLVGSAVFAAADTLTLTGAGNTIDGNYYVSPYTGTLSAPNGTTQLLLYCDDFNNDSQIGVPWSVNVTTANGNLSTTRFSFSNPADSVSPNPNYPVGRQLYEEEAWLFTQLANNSSNASVVDAIQEAAWHLTSGSSSQPSNYNSGAGDYQSWIALAAQNYNVANPSYATPDYSQWYVLTQTGYAGNTTFSGNQELFARYSSGSPIQVTTPEPGSMLLLGAGLIGTGLAGRKVQSRRRDASSAARMIPDPGCPGKGLPL
jgi:hypothetical protein